MDDVKAAIEVIRKDSMMAPIELVCNDNKAFCVQRSVTTGDEVLIVGYVPNSSKFTR